MTFQAIGHGIGSGAKIVGNALVPKFADYTTRIGPTTVMTTGATRIPSAMLIAIGAIIATLGIISLAYASSGILPAMVIKAGWTVATAITYSIILTAVGGGVMITPCIFNLIATAASKKRFKSSHSASGVMITPCVSNLIATGVNKSDSSAEDGSTVASGLGI